MLSIVQSQSIHRLFAHLVADMKRRNQSGELGVFDVYNMIVPSSSLKVWVEQQHAQTQGISAMVNAKFWGSYQWQLMADVLDAQPLSEAEVAALPPLLAKGYVENYRLVPKEPSLSIGFMQWRIFGLFQREFAVLLGLSQKKQHAHPLYDFYEPLLNVLSKLQPNDAKKQAVLTQRASADALAGAHAGRWWHIAKQIAQVFSAYLTHRPEWLVGWSAKQYRAIDVAQLVKDKDAFSKANAQASTPDWLVARYTAVEKWQGYIWRALFVDDWHYRQALFDLFWKKLHEASYQARLPRQITFFTLPPVPKSDLDVIRKLASYTDVLFLHYNPSQEYWADITDPYWLGKHSISQPKLAALRETGHFLLARMGKQARDTFKLLIGLSGNVDDLFEQVAWHDDFVASEPHNLLQQIQHDILLLQEEGAIDWFVFQNAVQHADSSVRIHACHSLTRQLEVLREDLVVWLNEAPDREPSDVVVMLPDLASQEAVIRAAFPRQEGVDGFRLPIRLTGLVEAETDILWQALTQRYTLLGTAQAVNSLRSEALFGWLMLAPVCARVNLSYEQMQRGCDLLREAGFKRGFDAAHLARFLEGGDGDARYTLRYALDRLALGLLMPAATVFSSELTQHEAQDEQGICEHSLPLPTVALDDAPIIQALLALYDDLAVCQHYHLPDQKRDVGDWLDEVLLADLEAYFHVSRGEQSWQEVTNAIQKLRLAALAYANESAAYTAADSQSKQSDPKHEPDDSSAKGAPKTPAERIGESRKQPLSFVLDALRETLASDMRGSEPTGAVTFCRMGTVRPIPFKLVVVLNMNIGDYPQYEPPNSFNIMHAGVSQVGDRQREDDETGAFLDALMMAEDACWFYYNGFSTADIHRHLPANPLQELMLFLENIAAQAQQTHASLQHDDTPNNDAPNNDAFNDDAPSEQARAQLVAQAQTIVDLPQFVAHAALPFSQENFASPKTQAEPVGEPRVDDVTASTQHMYSSVQRRKGFWYQIYHDVYVKETQAVSPFIAWPAHTLFPHPNVLEKCITTDTTATNQFIDGKRFVNDVAKPAPHFLRSLQVRTVEAEDELDNREPLTLDYLTEYNIRHILLSQMDEASTVVAADSSDSQHVHNHDTGNTTPQHAQAMSALPFSDMLPAGVVQDAYFDKVASFLASQLDTLAEHAPEGKTPTHDQTVRVGSFQITHPLPAQDATLWAEVLPTNGKDHHQLKLWLGHLLWQVARKTTDQQVQREEGKSICVYKSSVVGFKPVEASRATAYLVDWLAVWQYNQHIPVVLPVKYGLLAANKRNNPKHADMPLDELLTRSDINNWLNPNRQLDHVPDDCSQHPTWQLILSGEPALARLMSYITCENGAYIDRLYVPLVQHVIK